MSQNLAYNVAEVSVYNSIQSFNGIYLGDIIGINTATAGKLVDS